MLQHSRREAILRGGAPQAFWLLEHDPVITTGRRAVPPEHVPQDATVVATERGGLATWHGPGQLVGYLMLEVGRHGGSVKGTICAVEQGVIHWLGRVGLTAHRREGHPGVWVSDDKICAIGMHFRRGVSMHGFALNLTCDLEPFRRIVPCGITDGGVTSLAEQLGDSPDPHEVADHVGAEVLHAYLDHLPHRD
ncbi:MAG: lipoyl(octanoyl) transferase LipB [Myxococcales bacterium]|nr:lipoyl(octanoyl) transferase LipB [Myxococcales bacterium]